MKAPTVVLTVRVQPDLRERIARLAGRYSIGRPQTAQVTIEALTIGLGIIETRERQQRFAAVVDDEEGRTVPKAKSRERPPAR